jgi:hypothetical protein
MSTARTLKNLKAILSKFYVKVVLIRGLVKILTKNCRVQISDLKFWLDHLQLFTTIHTHCRIHKKCRNLVRLSDIHLCLPFFLWVLINTDKESWYLLKLRTNCQAIPKIEIKKISICQ